MEGLEGLTPHPLPVGHSRCPGLARLRVLEAGGAALYTSPDPVLSPPAGSPGRGAPEIRPWPSSELALEELGRWGKGHGQLLEDPPLYESVAGATEEGAAAYLQLITVISSLNLVI